MFIQIDDWADCSWGVNNMVAGERIRYNKVGGELTYSRWRFMRDPVNDHTNSNDETIFLDTSVILVASRDGQYVWSCGDDGYMQLAKYSEAIKGDTSRIRARLFDKHGLRKNATLPLGYQYAKMYFSFGFGINQGEHGLVPLQSGVTWQNMPNEPDWIINTGGGGARNWEYGFQLIWADPNNPNIQ